MNITKTAFLQERRGFLIPRLILSWIGMVLVGIFVLICLVGGFYVGVPILLVLSILPAIFLYAVHKRYAEMKEIMEPGIPIPMQKV